MKKFEEYMALADSFHQEVFHEAVELCYSVNAIADIKIALEAILAFRKAREYCNFDLLEYEIKEYNLLSGLLNVLGRDGFDVVLACMVKNALYTQFKEAGIDSQVYCFEFLGNPKACKVLNEKFSGMGGIVLECEKGKVVKIEVPVELNGELPAYFRESFGHSTLCLLAELIQSNLSNILKEMDAKLIDLYEQEAQFFKVDENDDIMRAVTVLSVADIIANAYFTTQGYDMFVNVFSEEAFLNYVRANRISLH